MMRSRKLGIALLGGGLFIAGWAAGQIVGGTPTTALPPVTGAAPAQADWAGKDPHILALTMGVASVAVDTEAAALRINALADRLAALERRVVKLEPK